MEVGGRLRGVFAQEPGWGGKGIPRAAPDGAWARDDGDRGWVVSFSPVAATFQGGGSVRVPPPSSHPPGGRGVEARAP